jgi:hypothetical protein
LLIIRRVSRWAGARRRLDLMNGSIRQRNTPTGHRLS